MLSMNNTICIGLRKSRVVGIIIPEDLEQKQRPEATFQILLRACYMGQYSTWIVTA